MRRDWNSLLDIPTLGEIARLDLGAQETWEARCLDQPATVMDAAAGAVSAIDPFSSWLPLPFRVAILLVLGTDVLEQSFVLN